MALRTLMLRKKIDTKRSELDNVLSQIDELKTREAELEQAIAEAETEEERSVVEENITEFERNKENLEGIKNSLEEAISAIEEELSTIEDEVEEPAPEPKPEDEIETPIRKAEIKMEYRTLGEMNAQERDAFFNDDAMQSFLGEVRTAIREHRSISNAGLLIPEKLLPMIRVAAQNASKLMSKVNKVTLKGTGRAVVEGAIPEAVWTEMCANLNELSIAFNDVEIDGYKVGGFFAICDAQLEDSDYNLAQLLTDAIGKAIGYALDKAIVYGKGVKMPLGIVTRLAQTAAPESYPATARTWVDLHTSNVIRGTASLAGTALYKEIALKTVAVANDYYDEGLVWVMNEKTKTKLVAEAITFNAAGAIVSGIGNTMPVLGGEIVTLSFIPDDHIVFGHFKAYMLGERKGMKLSSSEHAKFIEDKTVFKGTARYDGKPAIAEAFAVYTLNNTAATTTLTFASDSANG